MNDERMNDPDTTSEDESVATRERRIAAAIIFAVAFPGAICNALVAMFARAIPTLNNPFGRLTASQATGETFLCALFAFYYVPMVFLDIQFMKDSSGYVGILLLICYDICIFSHLIVSINRMSAIYFPVKYYIHFSNRNTTIIIVIIWTLAILLPILLRRGSICSFHYSDAIYTFVFSSNEECGWLRYFDFSQDVSIVTLIAIIDTTSIIKYRLTSIQMAKAIRLVTASKRKADMNLLKQTVAQGVVFAVELSTYFFFGWLFQNKWAVWSLTTLAWNVVHFSDAIIIITLNKEFRRFLCTILPWNSCAQKSRKYNGRVHPTGTPGIAATPRGSFPKQNQQSNSEIFEHAH